MSCSLQFVGPYGIKVFSQRQRGTNEPRWRLSRFVCAKAGSQLLYLQQVVSREIIFYFTKALVTFLVSFQPIGERTQFDCMFNYDFELRILILSHNLEVDKKIYKKLFSAFKYN